MEDIRQYIESGILELYILGDLSPEEKLQVEDMAAKHSAVRSEIIEIEKAMEMYAKEYAIEPSENLRGKILNNIIINLGDDRTFTKPRKHSDEELYEDNAKIVTLPAARANSFYKFAFAACLALLLMSLFALTNLYNRLQDSNSQLTALQINNQKFANRVNLQESQLNVYRDPSYRVLKLQGTPKTPQAAMTLAWNPVKHKVVVDMTSVKLPEYDQKHQYQLWALVGGKPVDLGVFDSSAAADTSAIKEMKSVASAEAFAVTLEPRGGSVNPTMDQMVVIGKF